MALTLHSRTASTPYSPSKPTPEDVTTVLTTTSGLYSGSSHGPNGPSNVGSVPHLARGDASYAQGPAFNSHHHSVHHTTPNHSYGAFQTPVSHSWEGHERYSPTDSVDDIIASPNLSDYSMENGMKPGSGRPKNHGKNRNQRRPSNRDEFDGPHQFLQRPPPSVLAQQDRELPHLPTNLHIQEQDAVLSQVNDRLSQCAFDFVAKYQFPVPLTQDMRPVERPQDREWTEWVYLLKRLATKRRIPARVLYNGQIKQFVTILENSLEMRHAAKHQSRPLKDDRNILQLISAGIQVAKILKDASAMEHLDQLYVSTENQIQERTQSRLRV
jgi:hypothetical protein